jgi:hypothetical protein
VPNRPVETTQPTIVVDAGLPPGPHRFQLVVLDAHGNRSQATEVVVTVTAARTDSRRADERVIPP